MSGEISWKIRELGERRRRFLGNNKGFSCHSSF
jgi:hypothetical protein